MKVEFGELKTVSQDSTALPLSGSFSLEVPLNWYKCREQFASRFLSTVDGFFFAHPHGVSERVAAFILKTEQILSLANPISFSSFCLTDRPYAVWINPSEFWRKCEFRRSLLTILLRCGMRYKEEEDNYEEALRSDFYAKDTEQAIRRFLFGHTRFNKDGFKIPEPWTEHNFGWYQVFREKTVEEIRKRLCLPLDTTITRTIIGVGSIWN